MRKGRCSNDPKNCNLAASKTELPYAGIDSVCPECGSPLAALAASKPSVPPPQTPPIVQTYGAPTPTSPAMPPPYNEPTVGQCYARSRDYQDLGSQDPERKDGVMKLTQMVIVGAAIVLIGFFAWRMFLQPRPATGPDITNTATDPPIGNQQVTQISPAQLRQVSVATDAFSVPDVTGTIIAQLPAGSMLDVTGQVQVNGVSWVRVSLPNESSKSGFVREDQMANLGDPALSIAPMDQIPGVAGVGVPVPEVIGPEQTLDPTTFYIASRQANIRQDANVTSTKVGTFEFKDPITIIAQRSVGARIWYKVQLPSGGTGWINGRLVSNAPRETAIDSTPNTPSVDPTKIGPKPTQSTGLDPEIGKADNQAALTAVSPGTTMRVDSSIANLRKEPGATGNSVVEVLSRDTLMSVEDVRIVNGVPWYRVTSPNGAQGWVSGRTVVENR